MNDRITTQHHAAMAAPYGDPAVERTYDWNGHTHPISSLHMSDFHVACRVRMLMRDDMDHEHVCTLTRDRLMALVKEKAALVAEVAALRAGL
jgi:hypothetical protein